MTLILHHALKDVRAVRGPLALWLAVLVADCAAQSLQVDRLVTDVNRVETLEGGLGVVGLCLVAFGWIIAAMIVQADPLDNPSAFWLTRPLSPSALLASKLLLVVPLFLLLPVVAATTVAGANGIHGRVLLQFALERLAVDAALLLPVLAAASVAHNLPRMVLVLAGGGLVYTAIHAMAMFQWMFLPALDSARWSVLARSSGRLVALALSVVGSLALIAHQYLTRSTRRTLWLGTAVLALAVVAGDFWPWNFLPESTPPPVDAAVFDPAGVRLSMDPDWLRRGDATSTRVRAASYASGRAPSAPNEPTVETRGFVRADGVAAGWILRVLRGEGQVRIGGQTRTGRLYGVYTGETPYTRNDPGAGLAGDVKLAFEQALQARIVNASRMVEGISVHLFDLPEAAFQQLQGTPGAFQANVDTEASRVVLSSPIPLAPGASGRLAGRGVTVLDVRPGNPGEFATIREARAKVKLAVDPGIHVLVRNRRTREAFLPPSSMSVSGPYGLLGWDMALAYRTLSVPKTTVAVDARWLADAELVIAVLEPVGTFEKPLVLDEFVLPFRYYYK
jgi:hypothetical protein